LPVGEKGKEKEDDVVRVRDEFLISFILLTLEVRLTVFGSSTTRLRWNPSLATNSSHTSAMSGETTVVGVRDGSERRER
jgi:hypothetical protein